MEANAFVCVHLCSASAAASLMPSAESHRSVSGGAPQGGDFFPLFFFSFSTCKVRLFHSTSKNTVWSEYGKMQIKSIPAGKYLVLCSIQTCFVFFSSSSIALVYEITFCTSTSVGWGGDKNTFWMFSPFYFNRFWFSVVFSDVMSQFTDRRWFGMLKGVFNVYLVIFRFYFLSQNEVKRRQTDGTCDCFQTAGLSAHKNDTLSSQSVCISASR